MKDYMRETLSYFGLYKKMLGVKKEFQPEYRSFGKDKDQYFLYYKPNHIVSDKVIVWIHGGGWNAGSPRYFDFVGQCIAKAGYHFVSLGYRLSPKNKYPCQIEDVCTGYKAAINFLQKKGVDTSKIIISGPSAGAHLASILCYSKKVQEEFEIDITNIKGFIGAGGPYSFSEETLGTVKILLNQLFAKEYDRAQADPCYLMTQNDIPMLLIHSEHDGLINYACSEHFCERAKEIGNKCELYSVVDKKNTHSWYTAGMFLETRQENQGLNKFFTWIEGIN